ncbi:MAG: hypothetical protein EKK53_05640 [Burkholderiales bacterium]|nr:MAG: hypothetical protein EKK53_05640 [Burkholderiales bacterium]
MALLLGLALAGCSSLSIAYNQLPFLGGLWIDSYLDLDSAQQARMKDKLRTWQAWHRREELPQWVALLKQATAALDDGVMTRDELLALERAGRASVERCLQHAAPLAAPVLADLRPEQWQHLQKKIDEKRAEWREKNAGRGGTVERGKQYVSALERWLGDLDRATRKQARAEAEAWHFDLAALSEARAQREARTLLALRAWSQQDLAGGTAQLMQLSLPLPAELPYREELIASVLKLFNGLDAHQRDDVRQHWADWQAQLRALQPGS